MGDKDISPGAKKAAMIILSLDEEVAAQVLTHMEESDLRILAKAVDHLRSIPMQAFTPALEDFEQKLGEPGIPSGGGGAYMRKVCERAFGADRTKQLFAAPRLDSRKALDAI